MIVPVTYPRTLLWVLYAALSLLFIIIATLPINIWIKLLPLAVIIMSGLYEFKRISTFPIKSIRFNDAGKGVQMFDACNRNLRVENIQIQHYFGQWIAISCIDESNNRQTVVLGRHEIGCHQFSAISRTTRNHYFQVEGA